MMVHSPTEDGDGVKVLRLRSDKLEAGEMRPLKEGASLVSGDVVRLHRREGSPVLWNVEVQYSAGENPAGDATPKQESTTTKSEATSVHAGPARVASAAYRRNWDSIFGAAGLDDTPEPQNKRLLN